MQSLFFSIFTMSSVSHDPSEIILICRFDAWLFFGAQLWIIVLIIISFAIIIFADFVIFLGEIFDEKKAHETAFIWNIIFLSTFILI